MVMGSAEEIALGSDFIIESPSKPASTPAPAQVAQNRRPNQPGQGSGAGPRQARRFGAATQPVTALDAWEKYAHVLLQANELVYLN